MRVFRAVIVLCVLAGCQDGAAVPGAASADLTGRVSHVRDGDTIEVAGVPIRLSTLDCAERDTAAGRVATARMRALVAGQVLSCHLHGRRSYDREIGDCALQGGPDIGDVMLAEGVCRRY